MYIRPQLSTECVLQLTDRNHKRNENKIFLSFPLNQITAKCVKLNALKIYNEIYVIKTNFKKFSFTIK